MKPNFSLKEHFSLSRNEQRGFFMLFVLLVLLTSIKFGFKRSGKVYLAPDLLQKLDSLGAGPTQKTKAIYSSKKNRKKEWSSVKKSKPKNYRKQLAPIEVNIADSATFTKLRGIGPVLSSRIIRFRNALGGFYSRDQIKEVYGLQDSIFNNIKRQLTCNRTITKIDLNKVSAKVLRQHPYCDYKSSKSLIRYRESHGNYRSYKDLRNLYGLDTVKLQKLKPYLYFSN